MNRPLSKDELRQVEVAHPVVMSRKEKLLHWANLIEKHGGHVELYRGLEHMDMQRMASPNWSVWAEHAPCSIAAADPMLQQAGLTDASPLASIKFFELTKNELHSFSCGCGGGIHSSEMAKRIRAIAG